MRERAIQYLEHTDDDGAEIFAAGCGLGLECIVSKRISAPYRSGPSKSWIKVKNPKPSAATRTKDFRFLVELRRCSNGCLCEVEVSNVIQVNFLWTRCAPERQLGLHGAKYAKLRS